MVCPICKNTIGFTFGTCVECGYNHDEHEFERIQVHTAMLKQIIPPYIFDYLVSEHEKLKRR